MPTDDPEIDDIQAEWQENWRHKRRWTVVEEIDGTYSVHEHTTDGVAPPSCYPDRERAAARLLQLLGLKAPVTPQAHPERVEIGSVDCGDEGEDE